MATIADKKAAEAQWIPAYAFKVTLKDAVARYWSTRAFSWDGNAYLAVISDHSPLRVEGVNLHGVDAVMEISFELNNADLNLNSLIAPSNWQGGIIQPFFIFIDYRTGTTTTDSIAYPRFLADLPEETWPLVKFRAHNKFNFARKSLPLSRIGKRDRYPFPNTAAERTAAGADPASEFFAIGYDPATGKGNWKNPPTNTIPYLRADYNGLRDQDGPGTQVGLKTIGLEVRHGGFGKLPPTVSFTPRKGERADFLGNNNEAKYGKVVPLGFGTVRFQPVTLDTGSLYHWNGARLSHLLLGDGVNFGPEATMGIEDVLNVYLADVKSNGVGYEVPETSSQSNVTGSWSVMTGFYGMQWGTDPTSKYRNLNLSTDFPRSAGKPTDFEDRDPYSGLAVLNLGIPKELAGAPDSLGPRVEVVAKLLKIETWGTGPGFAVTWQWSDNPIWIFVHLLKLSGWTKSEMDEQAIYDAAAFCDGVLSNGKKRFRCNFILTEASRADEILRGIRNNCRMYTSYANDGKLQLRIERTLADEGGSAFTLDSTNILRDEDGKLLVQKFYKSVLETANVLRVNFQDEDSMAPNNYISASLEKVAIDHRKQTGEQIQGDSLFQILGCPSFDQGERQLEWAKQKQVDLNEYYRVTASLALIENRTGQLGTLTEPRLGLTSQQCRILYFQPGSIPDSIDLILQKHSDTAVGDTVGPTPLSRALNDSTYTPRSVGAKAGTSSTTGNPTLTELFIQDDRNPEIYVRKVKVEFKPPPVDYEPAFDRATQISNLAVQTTGGSIAGNQTLFVEVTPRKSGVDGLSSNYMLANVPAGTSTNKFTFDLELPTEATDYVVRVGTFPGRLFKLATAASPGTAKFTVTVSSLSALDATDLSPDPAYDHALIFYRFGSAALRLAGQTKDATETSFIFEPEVPEGADTQLTVLVVSSDADENDFYPVGTAPSTALTITKDTGNPSGGSGLVLKTVADDAKIPAGELVFEWSRDTSNVNGVYAAMGVLSTALPAQGPYSAERNDAAHAAALLESGTGAVVVAGQKRITMTRASSAAAVGRVLLIWTADGTPDSDLDGNVIETQGTDFVEVTSPFSKGGTYSWAIVKRWWDTATSGETSNVWAHTFMWGEVNDHNDETGAQTLYRTKPRRYPQGSFYGTVYTRNQFGVGTRLTSALKDLTAGWFENGGFQTAASGRRVKSTAAAGFQGYSSDGTLRVVIFPTSIMGVEVNEIGRVGWVSGDPMIQFGSSTVLNLVADSSTAIPGIGISKTTGNIRHDTGSASGDVHEFYAETNLRLTIRNAGVLVNGSLDIDQGAADDIVAYFRSSDVAHGMTDVAPTNTYFGIQKASALSGGAYLIGLSEDVICISLTAGATNDNTLKSTSAVAPIVLNSSKKSGTTVGATGTDANLVVMQDNNTTVFIYDKEGEGHSRVAWSIYDKFDDVALLSDLQSALCAERNGIKQAFGEFIKYNRIALERAGLVHFSDNDPGRAFVNWTRLAMAQTGAVIQLSARLSALEHGQNWRRKLYEFGRRLLLRLRHG